MLLLKIRTIITQFLKPDVIFTIQIISNNMIFFDEVYHKPSNKHFKMYLIIYHDYLIIRAMAITQFCFHWCFCKLTDRHSQSNLYYDSIRYRR